MSTTPQVKCFAHYHMSPAEYGLWDVCRSLSHGSGILYFSGRNVAARFRGLGKTGAYNLAASLVESGWLKLLKESVRRKDGTWSPRQYQVLSHVEWASKHPNRCGHPVLIDDQPVLEEGQDPNSPVLNSDQPVLNSDQPVLIEGHNLKENYLKETTEKESDNLKPVLKQGLDGFVGRFLKPTQAARQRRSAAAPNFHTAPVPIRGLDLGDGVLVTQTAQRIATAINNTIGVTEPSERAAWVEGIETLLMAGHSTEEIQSISEFADKTFKPGTMKREGPSEFVKAFDTIKGAMVATAKGAKTA